MSQGLGHVLCHVKTLDAIGLLAVIFTPLRLQQGYQVITHRNDP